MNQDIQWKTDLLCHQFFVYSLLAMENFLLLFIRAINRFDEEDKLYESLTSLEILTEGNLMAKEYLNSNID